MLRVALAAALFALVVGSSATAQAQTTITVTTTSDVADFGGEQTVADLPGPDGQTSFREATIASTNTDGPETIAFDIPTSDPGFDGTGFTIGVDPTSAADELVLGDDGTTIDATTQPGGFAITVEGGPSSAADADDGLTIVSSGNTIVGLGVRLYSNAIFVRGSNNLVTGVTATESRQGIQVSGAGVSSGNEVVNSTVADNQGSGVLFINTSDAAVTGNTVTGNGGRGVFIRGVSGITVSGNLIDANDFVGIEFVNESNAVASGNTITRNGGAGVISGGGGFTISRNVITANDGLGINLLGGREDEFGVTRNSRGGPNFPDIRGAVDDGTATLVEGRVDYAEPESVTVELFANDAPDPSGFGEGQTFLATVTPDAKGRFTASLPTGLAGKYVTATATGTSGTTSEFSAAVLVAVPR